MTRIHSSRRKEDRSRWERFVSSTLLLVVFQARSIESLTASSVSSSTVAAVPSSSTTPFTQISSGASDSHSPPPSGPVGFYVHIPYCRRRCRYCNFAIVPVGYNTHRQPQPEENGDNDGSSSLSSSSLPSLSSSSSSSTSSFLDVIHEQYQADLFQEMDHLLLQPQATTTTTPPLLTSIYFGGGTPSLAPVSMIEGVLQRIRQAFPTLDDDDDDDDDQHVEITMEMDPGTFDIVQLQALKDLGINRISLGVQSFDDTILEQLGRVHRKKDIEDAVQMIHQVYGGSSSSSSDSNSSSNSRSGEPHPFFHGSHLRSSGSHRSQMGRYLTTSDDWIVCIRIASKYL